MGAKLECGADQGHRTSDVDSGDMLCVVPIGHKTVH